MRGLFITGTDTSVGKTAVACGLLRLALRSGRRLVPFKPAESGFPGESSDADRLWEAAGRPVPRAEICLYRFDVPLAPATAAAAAGVRISLDEIGARAARLARDADGLVVEGAGGLLVPYAPSVTTADVARRLGLPILLVARAVLGTVNHTALTVAEIRCRRLPLAGIVLCETDACRAPDWSTNARDIETLVGVAPLGLLAHVEKPTPDRLADALAAISERLLFAAGF